MLQWKNKPIDQLSKKELQQALSDSVGTLLSKQVNTPDSQIFSTFLSGIACGAFIAIAGIFMASAI